MTDDRPPLGDRLLLLRADATTAGGTGHMMRTFALAQAWIDGGGRARWLVADAPASVLDRIAGEGIEIVRIEAPAGGAEDAMVFRAAFARSGATIGIVDGHQFDTAYLERLGEVGGRVLYIDDLRDRAEYPVGFVLNQNAHVDRAEYPTDATCRFLLGTRYILLRREFVPAPPPRTTPLIARHLLVTFGGADPTGMTARTLDAIRLLAPRIREVVRIRVIVGAANRDAARLEAVVADPELGFHADLERSVADMPAQMAWADLAITSGGSTIWELARTGCPALVVETVPVEQLQVSGLARVGLFGHLGSGDVLDARMMADEIAAKSEDVAWRARMTALGMHLVDGAGAKRVVDALTDERITPKELR